MRGEGVGWEQELYVTLHSYQEFFFIVFFFFSLVEAGSDESRFNVLLIARSEVAITTVNKTKTLKRECTASVLKQDPST